MTLKTKLFLSVVIPAYNESENLEKTLGELQATLHNSAFVENFEILIVDDHSSDGTFELLRSLRSERVQGIRLSRRSGSHVALRAGITQARGEAVLCISADGQEDCGVLNEMIQKLQAGSHIVWGVRRRREDPGLIRLLSLTAYRLIDFLVNPYAAESNPPHADFYLLSRKTVDAINQCQERNTSLFGLILWLGFKQVSVEYDRKPRRSGKSKWRFNSRMRLLVDWIIAFSGLPLKLISFLGILTASLGFLYAIFVIVYTLLGYARPGWAETVTLILVLGGVQMIMLGVVGEYLWRTLDETRKRPLYFVEEKTGSDD